MMDFALTDIGIRYAGHPRGWQDYEPAELADRVAHWMQERGLKLE